VDPVSGLSRRTGDERDLAIIAMTIVLSNDVIVPEHLSGAR
jgi:hypothetical protein